MNRITHSLLRLAMHSPKNTDEEIVSAVTGFAQRTGQTVDHGLIHHFLRGRSHARQGQALTSEATGDAHHAYALGYISKPHRMHIQGAPFQQEGPLATELRQRNRGIFSR